MFVCEGKQAIAQRARSKKEDMEYRGLISCIQYMHKACLKVAFLLLLYNYYLKKYVNKKQLIALAATLLLTRIHIRES